MSGWWFLSAAIVAEIAATTSLMYSHGLSRPTATVAAAVLYAVSYGCLAYALKAGLDISVAYAVWSAVGTAALTVIGAWVFGEHLGLVKLAALLLIIGGVLLLHLAGRPASAASSASSTTDAGAPAADPRHLSCLPNSESDPS